MKYRRVIVLSEGQVSGLYRYGDIFQILPPSDIFPLPPNLDGDYPCEIEFAFDTSNTSNIKPTFGEIPEMMKHNIVMSQTLQEILLLLTCITNQRFFRYSYRQAWFISFGTKAQIKEPSVSEWRQEFYLDHGFDQDIEQFTNIPIAHIPKIDINLYYNNRRPNNEALNLPENITALLDGYFNLQDDAKRSFLTSCSLMEQGMKLWAEHMSLSITAFVSAIETLIAFDHKDDKVEKCDSCGQEKYKVTQKFTDFYAKYGSDTPEFKKYATKIYQFRSKILHKGELCIGERVPWDWIKFHKENEFRRNINQTCRICMINWLIINSQL